MIRFSSKTYVKALFVSTIIFSLSWATDREYPYDPSKSQTSYNSIQEAIDHVGVGDRVVLNGNFTGTFTIDNPNSVTIMGNGYTIDLTERFRISSSNVTIDNAWIQAPPYSNAMRIDAGCRNIEINDCMIYGNWQGVGNWMIDDWGSDFLTLSGTYSSGFQTGIDALNSRGLIKITNNCTMYSEGTAINQYWNDNLPGGCVFENSYLCFYGSHGIRSTYIVDFDIDQVATAQNSTIYPVSDGYSMVGNGPVTIHMHDNLIINCNHTPYQLNNGARHGEIYNNYNNNNVSCE